MQRSRIPAAPTGTAATLTAGLAYGTATDREAPPRQARPAATSCADMPLNKQEIADLEQMGEANVLLRIATGGYGLEGSQTRSEVQAWLDAKRLQAEAASSDRTHSREDRLEALASEANSLATDANSLATDANLAALEANRLATEANSEARKANRLADSANRRASLALAIAAITAAATVATCMKSK